MNHPGRKIVHYLISALVMAVGGWRRSPVLIVLGLGLVALGWSHGLLSRRR